MLVGCKSLFLKIKKKLGFTLIELLAVIAIIAILVSIMTPLVMSYTTKANAATNAANLRSVKATVATMLISGDINPESGSNAERINQAMQQKIDSTDSLVLKGILWIAQTFIGPFVSSNTSFYAEDGVLTIDGQTIAAPQAKAMNVDGIVLRKGTEMTLTFVHGNNTEDYNNIIVTYDGLTIDTFAIVAADGDEAKIAEIDHNFIDTNNDWVCDICGKGMDGHDYDEIVGGLGSNSHICADGDLNHYCDNADCGLRTSCVESSTSHFCVIEGCNTRLSDCNSSKYLDEDYHCCSICGQNKETHTYGFLTDTCDCGAERPEEGGGDTGSCVTSDTLVTMANGSKKRMDQVTQSDYLLVWDFFKGEYAAVPASVLVFHGNDYYDVVTLVFEDGTKVETIGGHDFFDFNLNEFVTIDQYNAASYVGHSFAKASGNSYKAVKLVDYIVETEYTGSYSLISALHNNFIVEDMISLTPLTLIDTDNFFEYFEVGAGMKYDEAKMQADIETYGLYTYEDFADYLTYEQYVALNAPYYKVLVGKGYITFADLLTAISAYVN